MKANAPSVFGLLLSGLHFMSWGIRATTPAPPQGATNQATAVSQSSVSNNISTTPVTNAISVLSSVIHGTSTPGPRNTTATQPSKTSHVTTSAPAAANNASTLPAGNITTAPITTWLPGTIVTTYNLTSNATVPPANNITISTPNLTNGTSTSSPSKGVMTSAGPESKVDMTASAVTTTSGPTTNATKAPSVHNATTTSVPVTDTSRNGPMGNATKTPPSTGNATTTSVPVAKTSQNGITALSAPSFLAFVLLAALVLCL